MESTVHCTKCNYKTTEPMNLYKHQISVHGYQCKECDFTTIFKRDLQRHIHFIHQEKSLICTQCHYEAETIDSLYLHFTQHHSSILYQCTHRQYHTKWRTNLCKHVKKTHPKQ